MKEQLFKIIGLLIAILLLLTIISYLFNLLDIINFSKLFSPKYDFIQRLILLLPYSFILSLFIFFLFLSKGFETPIGILFSFLVVIIIAIILLEFIYSTSKPVISPYEAITEPIERQQENQLIDTVRINNRLKQKINKSLDIIFYHGNYNDALKILEQPIATIEINVPENKIISILIFRCKEKIEEETKNKINAERFDPDFYRGYKYLINKDYSNAERYFRNNLTHQNRYFHKKSLTLLQRQGEMNLNENIEDIIRIRQLKELGQIAEKVHYNNPRIMYDYYSEMHSLYGEKGMTTELSRFSKLISIDEITQTEIAALKSKEKRTNLIYLTDVLLTDKTTGNKIEIKKAIIFIRASYFIENSHIMYFENIAIIKNKNQKYTIGMARISKETGIFNNMSNGNYSGFKNGIISFGTDAINIINFKPTLITGHKLSTFYYLSSKTDKLFYTIMKSSFKERINYYLGLIISFILTYILSLLLKKDKYKKEKINILFYILPFAIIIILSLLLVQFSYFISDTILQKLI